MIFLDTIYFRYITYNWSINS